MPGHLNLHIVVIVIIVVVAAAAAAAAVLGNIIISGGKGSFGRGPERQALAPAGLLRRAGRPARARRRDAAC
jgi:hypothetical protein